jgi:cation:H+ antiporter
LGVAGMLSPGGINISGQVLRFDFLVMLFVAVVSLPVFYIDNKISRLEGIVLFSYYLLYTAYLILQAAQSAALTSVQLFALFYIPLTFLVIVIIAVRSYWGGKRST